jgi:hypothetical protein
MKKPKWHAKALYLIFALALVVGLMPLTALAGEATIYVSGPCYAKVGEAVNFTAFTNPTADNVTWYVGGVFKGIDTSAPFQLLDYIFLSEGTYTVSAIGRWGNLNQTADFDILIGTGLIPQEEYNIIGANATFCVPTLYMGHVSLWRFEPSPQLDDAWSIVSGGKPREGVPGGPDNCVTVHGSGWGELVIYADTNEFYDPNSGQNISATTLMAIKKWGKIYDTLLFGWDEYTEEPIYDSGETQVYWDENSKSWIGGAYLYDLIIGLFITDGGETFIAPADGADVEWWVMDARAPVHTLPSGVPASTLVPLIEAMQDAYPSHHVGFGSCNIKSTATVSGDANIDGKMDGLTSVELVACGEEAVKIVVVAKYPGRLHYGEWAVFPEIISWNFWTQEVEKVPQVKWAGEEIVLEKQFGTSYAGFPVNFILEGQSIGALEGLSPRDNRDANGRSVWTTVDSQGVARALLHSQSQGKSNVICLLYEPVASMELINKHGFMVYWLAIEEVTLGNMQGERDYHNDGLWDPVLDSGIVTSATVNSITNSTKNWEDDEFVGKTIKVWKGEDGEFVGDLQIRVIVSNNDTTVWVDPNWDKVPNPPNDVQWYFEISDPVWDSALDDLAQELNVSQDALLRARVKGWFYDPERESIREKSWCDANANGVKDMYDYILPEGRWVLPDDWEYLAGPDWEQDRPHWDIMDQPNDNIMSEVDPTCGTPVSEGGLKEVIELGGYLEWTLNESPLKLDIPGDLIAEAPVIGPYSTLDTYAPEILYKNGDPVVPAGIDYNGNGSADDDGRKTIVPNGKLNWWDCPMPPAKIIFEVTDGPGFFKDVNKGQVYYQWVNTDYEPGYEGIAYTNPFYFEMIPDSPLIPPFVNNGGVDWDSWDPTYGPYPFWTIINQPPGMTPSDDQHPTKVEVYSDNHGEAMVWLNGDWNLDLSDWFVGAYDIPTGTVVGNTTVRAAAEYPYFRGEFPKVLSNDVEKAWTWGKMILGADPHEYIDLSWDPFETRMVFQVGTLGANGTSNEKMAFIWVCDRDGFPAVGEEINWFLAPPGAEIPPFTQEGVSNLLPDIDVEDGLLAGTTISPTGEVGGVLPDRVRAVSFARLPTDAEKALFEKFQDYGVWPADLDVNDYAVAAIYVESSLDVGFDLSIYLYEREGIIVRHTNLDFSVADDPDDPIVFSTGDANRDTAVNVLDMILVGQNFGKTGVLGFTDINRDGVINVQDLILVGQNFD